MSILSRKPTFILLIGDLFTFIASLWLALLIRYGSMPSEMVFWGHASSFSFLFVIWIIVFFTTGLYEPRTPLLRDTLSQKLIYAQLINIALAAIFFYFVTYSSITPKTNLIVYLVTSSLLVLLWRKVIFSLLPSGRQEKAILVGGGEEMRELEREVNANPHYNLSFVSVLDVEKSLSLPESSDASLVVIDFYNTKTQAALPELYNLLFSKTRFVDMHRLYESVFGRVALSLLNHNWFLENISVYPKYTYDVLKRMMDFSIALVLGLISLLLYPFVALAIKLDDQGPVFIVQERVGRDGKIIRLPKFRSMRTNDKGVWVKEHDDRITRVGGFLRKTRIDELPQLFSVVKGDLSLVGPRPDIRDMGIRLAEEIPYYALRNIIKPGLSGWAQTRQELPPQSVEETKIRLAYDFYYIKYRSLFLDLKIALQTMVTLAGRVGK